jgi:FAD/FMN-containing dehydrogenase
LDGALLLDAESRRRVAADVGGLVSKMPAAVLRPKSVDDVVRMVRFCRQHQIRIAARGQGHTTFGQAQVEGGLVIDMSSLDVIHRIDDERVTVDAGVTWRQLLSRAIPLGRTPPVLTGFQGLSIGGTLSVGGISGMGYDKGAQVDHVVELEVVTGEGVVQTCSSEHNRGLFEAMLGGLGRCGIIVRATLSLVSAPVLVRETTLRHRALGAFMDDLRRLARERSLDGVSGTIYLDPADGIRYEVNALSFVASTDAPRSNLLSESSAAAFVEEHESPYAEHYLRVDALVDDLRKSGYWEGVAHPWFDVFLPNSTIDSYLAEVLPGLDAHVDVGPPELGSLGQIHLFPLWTRHLRRPLLRVPSEDLVFLFDILTSASAPGHGSTYASMMLERNRRLFERAREVGGTRYNISAIPFSETDWIHQLGTCYPEFAKQQRINDPDGIMGVYSLVSGSGGSRI